MENGQAAQIEQEDRGETVIEPAKIEDAEAIREIQVAGWLDSYPNEEIGVSRDDILERMEGKKGELITENVQRWWDIIAGAGEESHVFVARKSGKVVGFVSPYRKDGVCSAGGLYVSPEARGQGIGSQLLQKALDFWGSDHDVYIESVRYNTGAKQLYERNGFLVAKENETNFEFPNGSRLPQYLMVHKGITSAEA